MTPNEQLQILLTILDFVKWLVITADWIKNRINQPKAKKRITSHPLVQIIVYKTINNYF